MTRQVISSGRPFEQTYGYTRAVRVATQMHAAGTAARGDALAGNAYVQMQDILTTVRTALEQAGARIQDVVRTVIYVTDFGDADLVGRAHSEVFSSVRPTSTMVQVSPLIQPQMRVEIEAYAVIDEPGARLVRRPGASAPPSVECQARVCTMTGPATAVAGAVSSGDKLLSIHASALLFDSSAPS